MGINRSIGKSKAKAALALANPANSTLPADAETRFQALESVDHWHTNLTQLDKVKGYNSFSFFSDGFGMSTIEKTSSYTLNTQDTIVAVDATSGNLTMTLPSASSCFDSTNNASIMISIAKTDSSNNTVTIETDSTETISGRTSWIIARQYDFVYMVTDGTNWFTMSDTRYLQSYRKDSIITSDVVVVNTTAETELFSTTFSANELKLSDTIETVIDGVYSTANSSDTFVVRVKINGAIIHSFTSILKNVTDTPVEMTHRFTMRSVGATASITSKSNFVAHNDSLMASDVVDTTIDTTIPNSISVTMEWSSADVNNSGTIKQALCKING